MEIFAEEEYNKYLKYVESFIGNTETSSDQLDALGFKILKGYKGAVPRDKIPILNNNECCIVNTDDSKGGGVHWLALASDSKGKQYFYDSFARDYKKLVPELRRKTIINSDIKDREQQDISIKGDKKTETNCGARCIAWLLVFQKLGPKYAELI